MAVVITTTVQSPSPLRVVQTTPQRTPVQSAAPTSATVQANPPS